MEHVSHQGSVRMVVRLLWWQIGVSVEEHRGEVIAICWCFQRLVLVSVFRSCSLSREWEEREMFSKKQGFVFSVVGLLRELLYCANSYFPRVRNGMACFLH